MSRDQAKKQKEADKCTHTVHVDNANTLVYVMHDTWEVNDGCKGCREPSLAGIQCAVKVMDITEIKMHQWV